MKWNATILCSFLLLAACAGCGRDEPGSDPTNPPTETETLQPIAQYSLAGTIAEPSGIVYHARNNSFLVVSDSHPELYEIGFDGRLIRTIPTAGADLEGISLSASCDTIYVVEEKNRQVVLYRADGTWLSSFTVDVATLANNALEGVTTGPGGNLFVLNEKAPGMLLEYTPGGKEVRRIPLSLAADYSDITFRKADNSLWIISDESRKIMQTDLYGRLLREWSLPFGKGEGIAIVRDTMYIVNDADARLYLFPAPK